MSNATSEIMWNEQYECMMMTGPWNFAEFSKVCVSMNVYKLVCITNYLSEWIGHGWFSVTCNRYSE